MSAVRLITFDVTNTIIRVAGGVGPSYARIAALYNTHIEPAVLESSFKTVYKRYNQIHPNYGVTTGLTPYKWWCGVVKDCFKEAGSSNDGLDKIAQHLYLYYSTRSGWEVLPDAVATLTTLKQRGLKLGVISNFDERLEKILKDLALIHYFDFVLASADVKIAKPNAEIFQMALKIADESASDSVHVGDNVLTDYEGAKKAGMRGVLLWDRAKPLPGNVDRGDTISQLGDLCQLLSDL